MISSSGLLINTLIAHPMWAMLAAPAGFDSAEIAAAGPVIDWIASMMAHLLTWWLAWLPPVAAIVALSLSVKLILLPLTRLADRWQVQVNRLHTLLQPKLRQLKQQYRGEQRHQQILALYRAHQISPLYPMKGVLGIALQVPLFFAAYHALAACLAMQGIAWLWIDDLSQPDALFSLPIPLPWLGDSFNLLPLLMTLINLTSARLYLAEGLQGMALKAQRRQLILIAILFLLLLYPFPAALLLYWTLNNLLDLIRIVIQRRHVQDMDPVTAAPP